MDINSITNLLLSSDNVDLNKLEKNKSYLYQYNKDKYCNIEQIVNDISQYHIKHHDGINPDPIVEFSVIGSNNTFTNVYDKPYYNIQNTKVFPVFSIITNFCYSKIITFRALFNIYSTYRTYFFSIITFEI